MPISSKITPTVSAISTLCISNSCLIIVRLWWKQFANQVKFGFCSEKQIITEQRKQREQRNQREPTLRRPGNKRW